MAGDNIKPLAGKRIVVTRAPEQAGDFISQLEALGAEVLPLPSVAFANPDDPAPLDRALRELTTFDWLLFTSRNAVRYFIHRLLLMGWPADKLNEAIAHPQVAVVGPATGEAALEAGFLVDHEASEFRGEALAEELAPKLNGKRVLLPQSDRANPSLAAALRGAGAEVVAVVAYRSLAPQSPDVAATDALRRGEIDVLTLFSPSALHNLIEVIGLETLRGHSGKMVLAAIGPVTSAAVRGAGLSVAIEAPEATAASLTKAITAYFEKRTQSGVKAQ